MKARVKYNNEIIDVIQVGTKSHLYDLNNVEFLDNPQDYWTRLEHQAAIALMGGMCGNTSYDETAWVDMAKNAILAAHILMEKMKEERK